LQTVAFAFNKIPHYISPAIEKDYGTIIMQTATQTRPMQSRPPSRKSSVIFTYEDYQQFPDDGKRYEIINGELFMSPAPITAHQRVSKKLTYFLESFLRTRPIGELFVAPYDVVLSEEDVVEPDLCVVLNEQKHIITTKNIEGAPDFVIEILSPFNRVMDIRRKKALYEQFGVKEYWIVDPEMETIQKFLLKDELYVDTGTFEKTQTISSEVVKGFLIEGEKVFG